MKQILLGLVLLLTTAVLAQQPGQPPATAPPQGTPKNGKTSKRNLFFSDVGRGDGFSGEIHRLHLRCNHKRLALRFVMPAPGRQKHPLSGFSLPGT